MFLSTSVLNNLMKKAYKTGLVVARTQDAQGKDWLYLAGSYWEVSVNKDSCQDRENGLRQQKRETRSRLRCRWQ